MHANTTSEFDEQTALLIADENVNSMQGFKVQYEYLQCKWKHKMINALHVRRNKYIFENICICLYAVSALFAYGFPIFWFFYVWIYLNLVMNVEVFVGLEIVNAQYIFVWIICCLYCLFAFVWMAIVAK